ncbi:MAG: hypothetical protein LUG50_06715 [Planctomycetaceae bacterium]|nr:hypothetical protein [Planctomycetaceae bacterium]
MRRCVLSLCDYTGVMIEPWIVAGYDALIVDLQHRPGYDNAVTKNGLTVQSWGGDVRKFLPPLTEYAAVFAFPPCTHLAVSGARWFPSKGLDMLCDALSIAEWCRKICEWSGAPWFLENPVSTISSYWRKPNFLFDPCEYAVISKIHLPKHTRRKPVCGPAVVSRCQKRSLSMRCSAP